MCYVVTGVLWIVVTVATYFALREKDRIIAGLRKRIAEQNRELSSNHRLILAYQRRMVVGEQSDVEALRMFNNSVLSPATPDPKSGVGEGDPSE